MEEGRHSFGCMFVSRGERDCMGLPWLCFILKLPVWNMRRVRWERNGKVTGEALRVGSDGHGWGGMDGFGGLLWMVGMRAG